jgi:acylphosphatase
MLRRIHVLVSGRVQGVGYRAATREWAESLQLSGWVRNLRDGRVEIAAEGEAALIGRFIELCREGPASARVSECRVAEEPPLEDASGFEVRRTG